MKEEKRVKEATGRKVNTKMVEAVRAMWVQ
jgi:hypothetical protein